MYPLELLPPQSDFQGKNFLRKNFHPFSGLDGGSSQHFYTHLNALKTARIESREDSKTLTVAEIGKNGVFFDETKNTTHNHKRQQQRQQSEDI